MNGGRILTGLALLLLFLICITAWGMGQGLWILLVGGGSLLVLLAGAALTWIGLSDWRRQRANAALSAANATATPAKEG